MAEEKDIVWMSGLELAHIIKTGEISPVEVLDIFLERIRDQNPRINAFVTIAEDQARKDAKAREKMVTAGETLGPLHGVPVAIKDNIPVKDVRTTWGSKLFENHVPEADMILVERLRQAGAIVIGKTNMPEMGLLGITENPLFGVTRNPWDLERTPGGSSGGSVAAVAAGMVPVAVGNDGGGSIRIPSALCGVYGLKPHIGRIPRYPTPPGWETLSSEGPITRTVSDAAVMMDIMAGPDERDYLSLPVLGIRYSDGLDENIKNKRFAYSPDLGYKVMDDEVIEAVEKALDAFRKAGVEIIEIHPDIMDVESDWVSMVAAETVATIGEQMEAFKEVCYPSYLGYLSLADQLTAVDYVKALYNRKLLWDQVRKIFDQYDFLLTPTTAVPAFPIEMGMGPSDIAGISVPATGWLLTIPFNLTQQPAASIPCGFTNDHLPIGLQIVGSRFNEMGVLNVSKAFETILPWRDKKPALD